MISAIYTFAMTTGANRGIRGARIEQVCGDPSLGPEKDYAYGMRIVRKALHATTVDDPGPTLFDPQVGTTKEPTHSPCDGDLPGPHIAPRPTPARGPLHPHR